MSFFGLGGGGAKLYITLTPPSDNEKIVPIDHQQRWKAHKNPFHSLKLHSPKDGRIRNTGDNAAGAGGAAGAGSGSQVVPVNYPTYPHHAPPPPPPPPHVRQQHYDNSGLYAYQSTEDVRGIVTLSIPPGKKVEHLGMKVEFVGRIDTDHMGFDGRPHYDFISLTKELDPPNTIYEPQRTYPFLFPNVEKIHESYHGKHVSVRYFVRVILERKFLPPLTNEIELIVQHITNVIDIPNSEPIKMEVGIEDCLHIEFEYSKRHYTLNDVIIGQVHFLLVRIKIKHMELAVVRRETAGAAGAASNAMGGPSALEGGTSSNAITETQVLIKHEVMDGAPVKGEVIPVKLFLRGIPADLTPTYRALSNSRFSVRYFLNLVLVDEEDRRYFKQQEIVLWRVQLG